MTLWGVWGVALGTGVEHPCLMGYPGSLLCYSQISCTRSYKTCTLSPTDTCVEPAIEENIPSSILLTSEHFSIHQDLNLPEGTLRSKRMLL
ncbi:hypothetical protein FKM82_011338 [Ascaphus truei]